MHRNRPGSSDERQEFSAEGLAYNDDMKDKIQKKEEEWKKDLTPEQYQVCRMKGTEPPFTGKYYNSKEPGMYLCAACGNELFDSNTKWLDDTPCVARSFVRLGYPNFNAILHSQDISNTISGVPWSSVKPSSEPSTSRARNVIRLLIETNMPSGFVDKLAAKLLNR